MDLNFQNTKSLADVRQLLRLSLLPKYGEREATAMARAVIMHLKGWNLTQMIANEDREASDYIKGRAEEILNLLMKDLPLQYALGEAFFYGLKLKVEPGVLIPRPETAELVDLIVKENPQSDLEVLDLCTGSGAIAIALARNLRFPRITAVDISPSAVRIAKENAKELKVNINVIQKDVFSLKLPSDNFDIIVSNPPYVAESEKAGMEANVLNYEPHEALFVEDKNPLVFYRRIADLAIGGLVPGGKLYLEINPLFAQELKAMLEQQGFQNVRILKDTSGKDRFMKCKSPEEK